MSLAGVVPGARLIRTSPNTGAFLNDLNDAIDKVVGEGMDYAIVPDVAGHWVKSIQANPLPIDWGQGVELSTPQLVARVVDSIAESRDRQMVIVQKVRAALLPAGFIELTAEDDYYAVVAFVRNHLAKVGGTRYFDIYR
ncbi:unnamed protein product [marine sediment metagenome]|uniref:Uncharacterized protein n=1 Tax=marine sediment metagenome TaxID=412755 RepID=X0T1A7_9ZZZZ